MPTKTAKANVEPVRQRTQYSCMASSMAMCLRALDHDVTEDEVNRVMGARPMKGAAWEQALATAQHYGCRATLTMPATVEQLKAWTDAGVPIMIAWNPEGRDWSHASVVFDVDDDLNVYVADPNMPNPKKTVRVVPEDEFYGKWYEKFPDYLVRRPACAIEREITVTGTQIEPRKASMKREIEVGIMADSSGGNPTKFAAQRDTPMQAAIWAAWDTLQGVERIRSTRSLESEAASLFLTVEVMSELYGTSYARTAEQMSKKVQSLEKQSRSWRTAYTLWREGKIDVDHNRLVNDLGKTLKKIVEIQKATAQMGGIKREYPELWEEVDTEYRDTAKASQLAVDAFTKAIAMARAGKMARARDKKKPESMKTRMKPKKTEQSTPRDPNARARAEQPGSGGAGTHKNRSHDVAKGRNRKPKHKNQDKWAAVIERVAQGYLRMAVNLNWENAAKKLLAQSKGTGQRDLHYRAYLRAVISGNKAQTEHLAKKFDGAKDARKDLIDETGKQAAYSGNPDGKPIYDVEVDHGEHEALGGGHDVMKRLQERFRVEQGHEGPLDHSPQLTNETATRKLAWDWRADGIRPNDSRLVGKKWKGKVLQQWGEHHSGAPFAIIPRDTRGMPGAQDSYQKVVINDRGIVTHDFGSVPQLAKTARGARLDSGTRRKANAGLIRAKLDGNGRFRKPEAAYSLALDVLRDYGIELGEMVSSHLFNPRPQGTVTVDLAFSNAEDPFSPEPITNTVLYLQYTELRDGVFEAVAYLS